MLKELVGKIAGKNTEVIVDIISDKKPVNEFKIADRLKLTINQTRNILYKLTAQNIVSFVRKKDTKKGWYIYSWSINLQKSFEKLMEIKKREIYNYSHLLESRKAKRFYSCPSNCMETNDENAMLHDFKCSECGQLLQFKSFEEEMRELKAKIEQSQKEIAVIKVELAKIYAERERKEAIEMEKKKKERQIKRALTRKKAMREKAKLLKKTQKKPQAERKVKKKAKKKLKKKFMKKLRKKAKKGKKGR